MEGDLPSTSNHEHWGDANIPANGEIPAGFLPRCRSSCQPSADPFVKTFKRGYARLSILPDAETVIALLPAWFEDYNEVYPHSGLKFLSPREFLRLSA